MKTTTIAIDLAKSVFEIGISHHPGHVARNHRLSRPELAEFMAAQPEATVILEACGSSHYWGRPVGLSRPNVFSRVDSGTSMPFKSPGGVHLIITRIPLNTIGVCPRDSRCVVLLVLFVGSLQANKLEINYSADLEAAVKSLCPRKN